MGSRVLGFLLALAALCPAQGGEGRAEFEDDLEAVRSRFQRRRFESAKRKLDRLLRDHAGQPYVLARRVDIADLMKQCLFREKYGAPEPADMVKGDLVRYHLASGRVKVRYKTPVAREDFLRAGNGLLIHRARFKGPHKLSFDVPFGVVVVCLDDNEGYYARVGPAGVEIGSIGKGGTNPLVREAYPEKLFRSERTGRWSIPFSELDDMEVRVNRRSIDVYVGYKRVARAKKPRDRWGYWAVIEREQKGTITVEGQAEPSWIQGRIDKEDQRRLAEFEKTYEAEDHLPRWLFRSMPETGDAGQAQPDDRVWPIEPDAAVQARLELITDAIESGKPETALAGIDSSGAGFPPVLRAYVRAQALEELGRYEEALEECTKVRRGDEDFVPVRIQSARLLRRLGKKKEACAVYRDLLKAYPGGAELHARAALFFVESGRPAEARRALSAALGRGLDTRDLRKVNSIVTKALNGPPFSRRFEHESRHYRVVTNIDISTAKRATRLLERAYDLFTRTLDDVDDGDGRRFTVYLFRGQAGYLKYGREVFGYTSPRTAGLYSLTLKQLLIWNLPERDEMLRTIRHEGFHQYIDRLIQGPPLWFNEGLAEYYEAAELVRGELETGQLVHRHFDTLEKTGLTPLPTLFALEPGKFMANATRHYAQSWAFVHFLRHTTPERARLFRRFWDAFRRFPSHRKATLHALRGQSMSALDREFRAWLREQ